MRSDALREAKPKRKREKCSAKENSGRGRKGDQDKRASVFVCEARPARLSLTSTPATAATCTVAAATGEASRLAPAGSADFRGAMENEDNEFQEMDTTPAATTTTDPTRKCRRDPTGRDDAGNAARKTVAITAPTSRRAATGGAASVDDDDFRCRRRR
ncbi:hypothetical protein HPB48_006393 [Haemaphysalis longicornis]|uniref:Uncharacterized protein n=1 Tax=Haemaphysalis longicornis TaxID=44386 RepID=A0A9J6FKG0_HAELO|nr:hypothetical protein HPB48_006393 [Haemaphysalis longicornis]